TQLEEFKGKFVVLSAFAQGEASVKGEFALSLKVTRSGSSIEWFDANFDPTNSQYQFSATGTYIPTDCTALQIYGKYAGNINHATFDSIKMTACDATATQSLLYLKTSSSSNEIPVPMNKLTSVSFKRNQNYYDLDTETITTEVIDDELDIGLFSSYDLKKLLAGKTDKLTYGAYVYDPASDIKFNTEDNAQYPLANGVKLGSVVYSPQGILYTKNINLTTDFKTGLPTSSYYVQTADNTGFSACDTKYYTAKNLLYKHVNNRGIVTEYTYESTHSNPTQIKIYDQNDASKYFLQTTSYADNGDRVSQESDEANNSTQNIYDNVGFADAVIDGKGNRTEYCTTHDDFMLKCMCQQATNGHAYTHFGYNAGLLTDLTKNNFAYDFVYNGMTDIKQVKIAGQNYLTATKNKTTTNDTSVVEYANGQKNETVTDKYGRVTSSKDYLVRPDGSVFDFGNIQNTYDYSHTNAKLTKHIDNHIGTVVNYSYDRYDAVKEASESIGSTLLSKVVNTKDSKNRLTQRVTTLGSNNGNTSVTNVYTYDSNALDGRLTNETIKLGTAQKASLAYNYDNFGRLTAKNGLQNVSYTYNTLSNGSRLTNQVKRVTYHDGSYDEYTYDKNGNITKVTLSTGDTVEYVYDSFNRLVEEVNCVLNQRTFFTYDNSGNITQKRIVKCEEQSDVTINYAYTNAWKDQLTSIGGQAITYDAIGNPLTYKGNTLYWSRGRMLERFGDKACYTYNSAGIRTEKCIKNKATKYVVSGSTILSETTDGVSTIYYHGVDGVVGFNRAGVDYFYRKNMQGDIIAIVNASGGVVAKYVYDAWGNHKVFNSAGTVNP
ncbi:MAG: RHS repeat protein, partial [Clostridia bacterium]|nr:RHS repeat protein [Clostridia bacterium]